MSKRPNILFLLTDEHAAHVAGFAGDSVVQTQNLDALAQRSVRFDTAVCASPICTPSRMCMMTGKEPHNCAAWSNHWAIFDEHKTWPGHFAEHGYRTCLVGKMHFGGKNQHNGFQHRPYGDLRHGLGHQPDPIDLFPGYGQVGSAGVTDIPESMLQDHIVTRESLAWLLEHQDEHGDEPWFCCASYGRPHTPFTAPGRYIRRYRDKVQLPDLQDGEPHSIEPFARRAIDEDGLDEVKAIRALEAYYACVDYVDDCIGELLDGLDRAGMLDNTIIIYTSDHGDMLGQHGLWGKLVYYNASVKVPLLMAGPGINSDAAAVRHPVSLMDLFPTTCALADIPTPENLDGVDQSSVLADPTTTTAAREFAPSSSYRYGVRINHNQTSEDEPHGAMRMVQTADWKYAEVERGQALLFDLKNDPGENNNLIDDEGQQERIKQMRDWLHAGFDWDQVHKQLAENRNRMEEYKSGQRPSTPNQYTLHDGRVFDAEAGLYDARWLYIPKEATGGIIPQMEG